MAQKRRIPYLVLVFIFFFIPSLLLAGFGVQMHTVTTGSMRPEIKPGDLIVTRLETMSIVKVGQVILFLDSTSKNPISHRVISVSKVDQSINVTTKGDSNPLPDGTITEPPSFKISRVVTVVAGMGWVVAALHTSIAKSILIFLLILLVIMYFLDKSNARKKKKDASKQAKHHSHIYEGTSHV